MRWRYPVWFFGGMHSPEDIEDLAASHAKLVDTMPVAPSKPFGDLAEHRIAAVSKLFGDLAEQIVATLPRNPERTVALCKLLESKDAAVRALIAK